MSRWVAIPSVLFLLGAGDPWIDASSQDLHGYARALSLDLRGVVPTAAELEQIEAAGEVAEIVLDAWLHSPEFETQVIAQHRDLFWNQLEINLLARRRMFRRDDIFFNNNRARHTRGLAQTHCGTEEADVDELNRPITWIDNGDGSISEGWVWVSPYWDPDTPIQVCALDAQLTTVSATGVDCSTEDAHEEPDCGCGPNLQWCMTTNVEGLFETAISEDLTERVRAMLQRDGSYDELLTDDTMFLNGRSTHFFRYIAPFDGVNYERPVPVESLPDLDYADETWTTVTLPDNHDGVLTAPGWLLRHQTNRGRANRFYGAFLCQDFILPETGIGVLSNPDTPTPNLILREGCLGCHARLEPWAAYWGRWSEASTVYRSAADFPAFSEACATCATTGGLCSEFCEDNYLVEAVHPDQTPFLGWYLPYAYLSEDKQENPDLGPLGWAEASMGEGSFGTCAAKNVGTWLLNWEEDFETTAAWAEEFNLDQSYRDLVKTIVTSPQYWKVAP